MLFLSCAYKFKRIIHDEIVQEKTPLLLKGNLLHSDYENYLFEVDELKLTADFETNFLYIRSLFPDDYEEIYGNISYVEAKRAMETHYTVFKPLFSERRFETVFCEEACYEKYKNYKCANILNIITEVQLDEIKARYQITPVIRIVGKIDHLFIDIENDFIINEFKTGKWSTTAQSKVRKELIFYKILCDPHLCKPVNKISYFFPMEREYRVEKVQKKTVLALKNSIFNFLTANIENKYPIKYYSKVCDDNCQFSKDCKLINQFRSRN